MDIKLVEEDTLSLRAICTSWDFQTDGDPIDLVKSMAKLMIESNGIGLAAPQVGINKRIFIMGNSDKLIACINPEILSSDGEEKDIEGCLSFPNLWLRVMRFKTINVRYQNTAGEVVELTLSGLPARVFQHELDHLNGVCFDTRVGPTALEIAKNKRRKRKLG